jgi:uncharacterized protein YbjT (DUF2867 family)
MTCSIITSLANNQPSSCITRPRNILNLQFILISSTSLFYFLTWAFTDINPTDPSCKATMPAPIKPRTIVVLGATGNQGSGVVRALLAKNSPDKVLFSVRAVTRDPDSPQAQRLLATYPEASTSGSGQLQLVAGDVYDRTSLERAFRGVCGVFAVTNNRLPTSPGSNRMIETEEDLKHELTAGENIVAAAKGCGVSHFVFSSLPNIAEASGGRFRKVFHFDHKFQIEQLARRELPAVTALRPGE